MPVTVPDLPKVYVITPPNDPRFSQVTEAEVHFDGGMAGVVVPGPNSKLEALQKLRELLESATQAVDLAIGNETLSQAAKEWKPPPCA